MKQKIKILRILFTAFLMAYASWLMAGNWIVPDVGKPVVAPFRFSPETLLKGSDIYQKNCKSCHGDPTKSNFAAIDPSPGDPASDKFQKDTDGELFYKITTGRGAMQQFKNVLPEDERWALVAYIRSFHPGYVQPEPAVTTGQGRGPRAELNVAFDSVSGKVLVHVTRVDEGQSVPVNNAEVIFFVKRFFGNMRVGDAIRTGHNGQAGFSPAEELPGDREGNITLIAQLDEKSGYGDARQEIVVPLGKPVQWVSLTGPRAMWNVNQNAPVWLIFAYSLTVIGVLITLLYILFRIRKIYLLGSPADENDKNKQVEH
jgi:mono/diheme cytochrome c family protein